MEEPKEFGGIGRAYWLVFFLVFCVTTITIVSMFTDPRSTGSMLQWMESFLTPIVMVVVAGKELAKALPKMFAKK